MVMLEVKSRDVRKVGDKVVHVKVSVHIADSIIFSETSSEYGMTRDTVVSNAENFMNQLRSGLAQYGVQSSILRTKY